MRRILCVLIVIICVSFMLVGCSEFSNKPNEGKFLEDYSNKTINAAFVNFEKCEIIRQQTNEQEKQFTVAVKLSGSDEYADYEVVTNLVYNYYDDQGWMLDDFTDVFPSYECKKGRDDVDISQDLKQNFCSYIPDCTEINYISHQFIAAEKADVVEVEWTTDSNYLITKNTGSLKFEYLYGEWKFGGISKNDSVYKLKLEGTYWEPSFREYWNSNRPDNIDYIISEISDDSTVIIFKDSYGNSYKAQMISDSYKDDFEKGYSVTYSFEDQNPYIECDISGYNKESYKNGPVIKMYNSTSQTQLDYNLNPLYYMKK